MTDEARTVAMRCLAKALGPHSPHADLEAWAKLEDAITDAVLAERQRVERETLERCADELRRICPKVLPDAPASFEEEGYVNALLDGDHAIRALEPKY